MVEMKPGQAGSLQSHENFDELWIMLTDGDQAKALSKAGARMVVITRGEQGLYADDGERSVEMGIFKVSLVDPSSCGDCFTAGLIAALLRG